MRIRPSKNENAVQEAIAMHQLDEDGRARGAAWSIREDGTVRGPRGIVKARVLGLSRHRYRAARTPKRDRRKAQIALCTKQRRARR